MRRASMVRVSWCESSFKRKNSKCTTTTENNYALKFELIIEIGGKRQTLRTVSLSIAALLSHMCDFCLHISEINFMHFLFFERRLLFVCIQRACAMRISICILITLFANIGSFMHNFASRFANSNLLNSCAFARLGIIWFLLTYFRSHADA